MSGALFGNSSSLNSGNSNSLVEFRAGKMEMKGSMVHPDLRKGLLYLYQTDDSLVHFCWKDRTTGNVEEDLIIFPDDCEFKKVDQCKTGRVFLLRFKSSGRKSFYWMQEPKSDKDDEWCRRINEVMNNPPTSGSGSRNSDNGDLQYMLNNMSQQQLMQLFGGVGQMGGLSSLLGSMNRSSGGSSSARNNITSPSNRTASSTQGSSAAAAATASTAATPTATVPTTVTTPKAPKKSRNTDEDKSAGSENSRVLLTELQQYLAGINAGGSSSSSSGRHNVDLSTVINSDALTTISQDPQNIDALIAHLPEVEGDEDKKQQLKDTLSSPQFQQALSTFSSALQSGQLGPVVSQFKLSTEAVTAAVSGDLEQFVKALENTVGKTSKDTKKDTDGGKDDDDQMTLG